MNVAEPRAEHVHASDGETRAARRAIEMLMIVNERAADGHRVLGRRADVFSRLLAPGFRTTLVRAPRRPDLSAIRSSDLVYVIDPGRTGFPAVVAAWLARRPVVVEMGDPQAALYRNAGRGRLSILAGGLIDWLVGRGATAVVVRGRGLVDAVRLRARWVEIPDGVDVDRFVPNADNSLRRELGIPDDALVAGLVGSLRIGRRAEATYGWDLVEAMSLLRDQPIWALIVGDGDGADPLRRRAEELSVSERVVFPGHVRHESIHSYIAAMDVCVSRQTNDEVGRSRTTAKLPEYLACDRYVLATAVGAAADVLPDEMLLPYHGSYDPDHPRRLAERLVALVPRRAELRHGGGTRRIAVERYSYPALADSLGGFLRRVVESE
jgi:glycosyltransferase involved in cell wall biosynthesis